MAVAAGLRERKKQQTRERIVAAAFDLFQTRGYEETTLHQIAERADVAQRTVSNYFPQKVDLLVAYRLDMLAVVERALEHARAQPAFERVRAALLAVARQNQRHPSGRLAQRLLARHGSYRALESIQDRFRSVLKDALSGAELRRDVDLDLAVLALAAAHMAVIQRWAAEPGLALTAQVDRLYEQWLAGVAA
jgi:AcrR family transcriptional regulator